MIDILFMFKLYRSGKLYQKILRLSVGVGLMRIVFSNTNNHFRWIQVFIMKI